MVASASLGCTQELLQPIAGAGTRGGTGSMAQAPMVACKSTRSVAQATDDSVQRYRERCMCTDSAVQRYQE